MTGFFGSCDSDISSELKLYLKVPKHNSEYEFMESMDSQAKTN
jgi:hypothetical protein